MTMSLGVKRAKTIKENILNGIQWDKISFYGNELNVIKHSKKIMNGYSVENNRWESGKIVVPGFTLQGIYTALLVDKKNYAAILSPHGHLKDKRFTDYVQLI